MSTLKVEILKIDAVNPHPNADRLELAQVRGWNIVVGKANFRAGDVAIYFPVDSVLPFTLESQLFPPDAKIKLSKSRIRSIKIRGAISQGMLVKPAELGLADVPAGTDVTEQLGVTKYEPPEPEYQANPKLGKKTGGTAQINPHFEKYTDIENVKNYPATFRDGEGVYISEKLHGTSARYGYVPRAYRENWLGKLTQWSHKLLIGMGLMSSHEFVFGSRNVQLHTGSNKTWYKENYYAKILVQENLKAKLGPGECVYGEIVGDRIQTNYTYGCGEGEHKFYAYDVKVNGRWLDPGEFMEFCDQRGIARVPELYVGPYSKDVELKYRDGDSTIGGQKVREGVVVKALVEETTFFGRKVLKSISDAYYLADNSDFH
jgi:RNA ligase (TIGR02306 family)